MPDRFSQRALRDQRLVIMSREDELFNKGAEHVAQNLDSICGWGKAEGLR